jgi:hypothetical protein
VGLQLFDPLYMIFVALNEATETAFGTNIHDTPVHNQEQPRYCGTRKEQTQFNEEQGSPDQVSDDICAIRNYGY